MKLTEFRPGQTVVVLRGLYGRPGVQERTVESVGRKYVTLSGLWKEQFFARDERDDFLLEKPGTGEQALLFPSETAYDEHCERKKLDREIADKFARNGILGSGIPLGKLRRIKEIIDEEDT